MPAIRLPSVCCAARPNTTAGERPAKGKRLGPESRDPQSGNARDQDRQEADQEANGSRGRGIHPTKERRRSGAPDVPRQRPPEDHERQHRRSSDRGVETGAKELLPICVYEEDSSEQQQQAAACRRARPTVSWLTCAASPTFSHAWLRVSNIRSRERSRRFLDGFSIHFVVGPGASTSPVRGASEAAPDRVDLEACEPRDGSARCAARPLCGDRRRPPATSIVRGRVPGGPGLISDSA